MTTTVRTLLIVVLSCCSLSLFAAEPQRSPYAGMEMRSIKALSAAQVSGYLAGEGMGMALPAELNGYPGPRHVLDAAEELRLTAPQKSQIQSIFDAMHQEAVELGKKIVSGEESLDRDFAAGKVSQEDLARRIDEIAVLQGKLRLTHLQAHLRTKALLTTEQIAAYQRLRGYAHDGSTHSHHQH
ncbi:MAG: Spy/CpxP family protein refolding chaperone [Thermoanaerobaculia bacterium]